MEQLAKIYKKKLKHSVYQAKKLKRIFSTSKKIRISLYKRIYMNNYSN